ncbi:retrovirus-related pol polyprotein from transposon TNT 1-94 [Tanacetum coccineum]|uniref:Retrovirus-related pol polyprotein from transposon TNT 1-94 n=1 Tax=Tanacetum coccineum TaxID=301880 RepID=A0ABQ4XLF1_9ASTR
MDLCGPMRIQSINGRKYILVIVDDYSWFTWVKFPRSNDEVPEFEIKFPKMIQVRLNATVRTIRIDNGTEFFNQTLRAYYEDTGISHQTSVARTPQQNSVVERRIQTLVEAARTMLIFSKARDSEDIGKLNPKADIRIFVSYSPTKKAFRIYNKRTHLITKTIHVDFDEMAAMASEQFKLADSTGIPSSTHIDQDAPSPNNDPFFGVPIPELNSKESSSRDVIPTNVHSVNQPPEHLNK